MCNHKLILTSKNLKPNYNTSLHQREVLKRMMSMTTAKVCVFSK